MAVLSVSDLQAARQACAVAFSPLSPIAYTKPQINAALQAIEDGMVTRLLGVGDVSRTVGQVVSGLIDAATTPFVFSAAQKKQLFALWAFLKFNRDKV